jgi:superfamily II DNA or RNA helicase
MIPEFDEVRLQRAVGAATLALGRSYAEGGAVTRFEWDAGRRRVVGEVVGRAARPYQVVATVTRGQNGRVVDHFDSRCSCPVGRNCKHAVALLLSSSQPALRVVGDAPSWAVALGALLAEREQPGVARVALQLELVAARAVPGKRAQAAPPGIRLRPVQISPAGNWVRTGISWSQLDYFVRGSGRDQLLTEGLALLRELRALHELSSPRSWRGYGDEAVWLESIASQRVWSVLRRADEIGLPLVGSGRSTGSVTIEPSPAELTLDLTRDGAVLHLRPTLVSGHVGVPAGSSLLVGAPAHGVAWWDGKLDPKQSPPLHLAPLAQPLPPELTSLLSTGTITIPAEGTARFANELYPRLRRRFALRSSDGSVDLPEAEPDVVVCALAHGDDLSLTVEWSLGPGRTLGDDPDPGARGAIERISALLGVAVPEPSTRMAGVEAARFVIEVLPQIEAVEVVEVRHEGASPDYREVTEIPVVRLGGAPTVNGDWFDLLVEVSVGGHEVPFQDLFVALAEGQSHLLLPSGAYFSLDRPELHQLADLIAEARSLHDAPSSQVRLSRFQADLWEDFQRLGIVAEQAGAWTDAVRALTHGDDRVRPVPAGLSATLRPYQHDGFQWLAARFEHRLGGILADDMGLGKTLQALALVCHAREGALTDAPFLVVAPTSVVGNWSSEVARFAPGLAVATITETTRRRGEPLAKAVGDAALVITSYTLFRLDFAEYEQISWAGLLLDEAQFAKNPASHNYQRARRLPTSYKLAMTGTPLENSLSELWALTSITAPGLFARLDRFEQLYRVPIERQADAERMDQLRRRIRPIMLRRTKAEVLTDLPDKQEQVLEVDLDPRHRKLYQTYLHRERQKVLGLLGDMKANRFEILRSLTLLRQAALDMSLVDVKHKNVSSAKLDVLTELVSEAVADGHRVLVFSQFTRFLSMARQRVDAAGISSVYLDGRTRRRAEVIARFREGEFPVFFISLKAGGFGLNLTEADHCILLDPWWNPATEAQAVDRVHRIGQTRKVMVHRLVARDTIEEKVMALKERKAKLFASVVDSGGFESATLSARDIRDLLD